MKIEDIIIINKFCNIFPLLKKIANLYSKLYCNFELTKNPTICILFKTQKIYNYI